MIISADLNDFAKHERQIGDPEHVVITEPVRKRLPPSLRDAFGDTGKTWACDGEAGATVHRLFEYPRRSGASGVTSPEPASAGVAAASSLQRVERERVLMADLELAGFHVARDAIVGGQNVDLYATRTIDGRIQRWALDLTHRPVPLGIQDVREAETIFRGLAPKYIDGVALVSPSGFTSGALAAAKNSEITLVPSLQVGEALQAKSSKTRRRHGVSRRRDSVVRGRSSTKTCFVAMPYGDRESGALYHQIRHTLSNHGYALYSASNVEAGEDWKSAIRARIRKADLVIVVMNHPNPNLTYELGFAQGLRKPTIVLVGPQAGPQTMTDLPLGLFREQQILQYKEPRDIARGLERALVANLLGR